MLSLLLLTRAATSAVAAAGPAPGFLQAPPAPAGSAAAADSASTPRWHPEVPGRLPARQLDAAMAEWLGAAVAAGSVGRGSSCKSVTGSASTQKIACKAVGEVERQQEQHTGRAV